MTPAAEPPAWLDELDLHVGPPDAAMGTRVLDLADWFVVDGDWDRQRAAAAALVASAREEVVVGVDDPAVRGPSEELLTLVADVAPAPPSGTGSASVAPGRLHPLVDARLLVADDLCVLLPDGDRWVLAAGCVCFPSYWRPADKVGLPLGEVHAPVPGYPGSLADRVDAFLSRLRPGRAVWRRNWLIHDVPELHLPLRHATEGLPVSDGRATEGLPVPDGRATEGLPVPGRRWWLRSERQALVRLVDHDAVVFSIRTQQVPVDAVAGRPDVCAGLAAALRGWSPALRAYKGAAVDDDLLGWLDAAAG